MKERMLECCHLRLGGFEKPNTQTRPFLAERHLKLGTTSCIASITYFNSTSLKSQGIPREICRFLHFPPN